jgi:Fe-S oxidoreductase
MSDLIAEGYDAIASCTSCSMALCQEHPELFDIRSVEGMAANTFETVEYLRVHENLRGELAAAEIKSDLAEEFAYNAPCHARNQGLDRQAVELFRDLNGVDVEDIGESCSDISEPTLKREVHGDRRGDVRHMEHAERDEMTECPTCATQMNTGRATRSVTR